MSEPTVTFENHATLLGMLETRLDEQGGEFWCGMVWPSGARMDCICVTGVRLDDNDRLVFDTSVFGEIPFDEIARLEL